MTILLISIDFKLYLYNCYYSIEPIKKNNSLYFYSKANVLIVLFNNKTSLIANKIYY